MNENLKKALEMMLFMSDQQVLSEDIEKINFKKDNWFRKYTWTEKREEEFINWLSEDLKDNWKGITSSKPSSKKIRDKVAKEFTMNYGCVTRPLTIKDFSQLVPYGQLEEVMSKRQLSKFNKWMTGQTSSVNGIYRWDLERYLNGSKNLD